MVDPQRSAAASARVMRCILFTNGMVMTFGHYHQQIPELQGPFAEVGPRLWDAGVRAVEYATWSRGSGEAVGLLHLVRAEDGTVSLMPDRT